MKKFKNIAISLCVFLTLILLTVFAINKIFDKFYDMPSKEEIFSDVEKNREEILNNIKSGDVKKCKGIGNIKEANEYEKYIDFYCGGAGTGGQTKYAGFFYFENDDLEFVKSSIVEHILGSMDDYEITNKDGGYQINQLKGDNILYFEKIEDHFYYYKSSF